MLETAREVLPANETFQERFRSYIEYGADIAQRVSQLDEAPANAGAIPKWTGNQELRRTRRGGYPSWFVPAPAVTTPAPQVIGACTGRPGISRSSGGGAGFWTPEKRKFGARNCSSSTVHLPSFWMWRMGSLRGRGRRCPFTPRLA